MKNTESVTGTQARVAAIMADPQAVARCLAMSDEEKARSDAVWESLVERYVGKRRPGEVIVGVEE